MERKHSFNLKGKPLLDSKDIIQKQCIIFMADAQERLAELGAQMAQEEQIQLDLQNRFKESTERVVKIKEALNDLAKEAHNPSNGEACPA